MFNCQTSDLDDRKRVLNPTQSFIVQAPAGSGKTTLLVTRYLKLLSQVNNPEEILAITFTKKAAFEMRSRIIEALKKSDENIHTGVQYKLTIQKLAKNVLKQDQIKKWNIIKNPNRLRIQTIDAFCYSLVSQEPIATEITPKHHISQNQDVEIYYRKAARAIFENLNDPKYSPHLETLLYHLNNDWERTENLFITMLKSREQWLPHIVGLKNTKELRQSMEQALKEVSQENIEKCIANFPQELREELRGQTLYSCRGSDPSWQEIARLLLTKDFAWRKKVTAKQGFPAPNSNHSKKEKELYKLVKTRMEILLNKLSYHENLRLSLENLLLSPPPQYSDQQWKIIKSLLELLPLLAAHLKVIFAENMLTDHTEISMAALRVLGEQEMPSDLVLNLDYRLQHILIDEFQDTSISQHRLLEKLTAAWEPNDGRTIFIVGDPMQSIYRFREAEVGLFLRVQQEGIGNIKLTPLTLNTNFRSIQNIIDWINSNFVKILPKLSDISLGAVSFIPSAAITNSHNSSVNINLLKDGDDSIEASYVISIIQKIVNENPNDTIAILVKARPHLLNIIATLKKANLNYQGVELEHFSESTVVQDLFSLTRALADPTDRIAWIAILRAPWCGLTLEDLYKIAHGEFPFIWDSICNHQKLNLTKNGGFRLIKLKTALTPILAERNRVPIRELIEKAWFMLGGPATVNNEKELEYVEAYLELLTDPFDIEHLQKKLETLYISPTPVDAKIQIMTIHKAKGLEFDHVIIPSINRATRLDERKLMLWLERPNLHYGSNLLLAPLAANSNIPNHIYQYLQSVEQKKSFYETGRLLYVAMTRAKKSVYVTGYLKNTEKINYASSSLLEQLKPCFKESWITEVTPKTEPIKLKENAAPKILRFTDDWQLPVTIKIPLRNNPPNFTIPDNQSSIIGSVIHYCLYQISMSDLKIWTKSYINKQKPYWRKLLQQSGYIDLDSGIKIINEAITLTLNDKRGQWILSHHQDAKSEFALTSKVNNRFEHYIIDRTFIDKDGYRWIIDYKTSKPENKNREDLLQQEKLKYSPQLLQYAKIMHNLDSSKTIKLGLYYPLFSGWCQVLTKDNN